MLLFHNTGESKEVNHDSIHSFEYSSIVLHSLVSPGMASHSSPLSPEEATRVVYYLDKDETPYRTTIPKRSVICLHTSDLLGLSVDLISNETQICLQK